MSGSVSPCRPAHPVERLADEPAEHAACGGEMVAGERELCRVVFAVLGIECGPHPGVFAVRLHVGEQLLADFGRAVGPLLPGEKSAQGSSSAAQYEAQLR